MRKANADGVRASMERVEGRTLLAGNGLAATYFNNMDLTAPAATRVDAKVDFAWGMGSPDSRVAADTYSARWTGQVQAKQTQAYTFSTLSDDGVRVWVNGALIINQWNAHAVREDKGAAVSLVAGQKYDIKVEYFERAGGATMKLMWAGPGQAKEVVPQAYLYSAAVTVPPPSPVTPPPTVPTVPPVTPPVGVDARVLKVSTNGRYLTKADGTPFFYMADTAWQMPVKLTPAEVDLYLNDRAAKGFNVIQIVAVDTNYGARNYAGQSALLNNNPATPNEAFFKNIDTIVAKAAARGMYVAIVPTWGSNVAIPARRIFTPATGYSYGHFIGSRYQSAWNVVWLNGGDENIPDQTTRDIWRALARGIGDADKGLHLMTFHPRGGSTSRTYWGAEPWLDFNMTQSGHVRDSDAWNFIAGQYNLSPVMPIIEGEPNYENIGIDWYKGGSSTTKLDAYDVRKKAYWEIFAGAAGTAYGANEVYQFRNVSGLSWQAALNLPGAQQMRFLKALMESRPMLGRVPDQGLLATDALGGTHHIQATRDAAGSYAFVYSGSGRSFAVNMTKITDDAAVAYWYDPRTGKLTRIGQYATTGARQFVPPTSGYGQDWVLVLDSADAGYAAPKV